jgi:DNA replicative helicase MCM subunit Mcm2 (Cdc46/Mcm family)
MFSLTREEIMNLSQIVTSSKIKHAPRVFAFTEQGVAMLSSVLRSKQAISVNIQIIRTFVKIRLILSSHKDILQKIENMEKKYDNQFKAVFAVIRQLIKEPEEKQKKIGF